jgi:Na+(H+)/acetate symporter ActP
MGKPAAIVAAIVGLLFCVVAVIYMTQPASALPSFLPGHGPGLLHHTKHGILALVVGLACFVAAWFLSGPKQEAA